MILAAGGRKVASNAAIPGVPVCRYVRRRQAATASSISAPTNTRAAGRIR